MKNTRTNRKLHVAILFGGRSGEHDVSRRSAASVLSAIDLERFQPVPVGITRDGVWLLPDDPVRALAGGLDAGQGTEVTIVPRRGLAARGSDIAIDVVFPVLHGPGGEDGTVQGLLDIAGLPYVGAGVLASALAMDKLVMKQLFRQRGFPVVDWVPLARREWERDPGGSIARVEAALRYPVFTKPANLGSSVGIRKCRDRSELRAGLDDAARFDRRLIVEQGLDAREVECSVLGNDLPAASLPAEILPGREFYDYEAKYTEAGTRFLIPAPLARQDADRVRELAVAAFVAVDCAGLARVDFFLDRQTGRILINELNTIPGFTEMSVYPKLWEASGVPYGELIGRLVDLALDRHADRARSRTAR